MESTNHLFILCPLASAIWCGLLRWWGIDWVLPFSLSDLFVQWEAIANGPYQKKVWMIIFFSVLWTIWNERNAIVFNAGSLNANKIFFLIIHRAEVWLKNVGDDGVLQSQDLWLAIDAIKGFRSAPKP